MSTGGTRSCLSLSLALTDNQPCLFSIWEAAAAISRNLKDYRHTIQGTFTFSALMFNLGSILLSDKAEGAGHRETPEIPSTPLMNACETYAVLRQVHRSRLRSEVHGHSSSTLTISQKNDDLVSFEVS